mmetsp:Transcript_16927/g.16594  ORF Transcript_16927/g.16594 Transcript_16927/m.16594 type:complete len:80 (-) Transcript_16927:188-427(-)
MQRKMSLTRENLTPVIIFGSSNCVPTYIKGFSLMQIKIIVDIRLAIGAAKCFKNRSTAVAIIVQNRNPSTTTHCILLWI